MHDWMFAYIFNFYDLLLLTVTILAVLLIIPLLLKKDRQTSDLLLSAFLFSQGASSLVNVLLFNQSLSPLTFSALTPFQFLPIAMVDMTQGFLLLWYCQSMIGEKTNINNISTWAIATLFILIITLDTNQMYYQQYISKHPTWSWMLLISSTYLGVSALRKLLKYDRKIRQNYSNIDKVKLNWLWYSSLGFVGVWALKLSAIMLGSMNFGLLANQIATFSNIPPLLLLICMVIYSQTTEINGQLFDPEQKASDNANNANQTLGNQVQKDKIENLMTQVKIYQDPELRLEGLADSMGISPRSVSSLLNGHYRKNFYDFINFYRVKDAEQQLKDPINLNKTIQRIFEDAGFNSKTTFNTLFKKLTGQTPSEYRRLYETVG